MLQLLTGEHTAEVLKLFLGEASAGMVNESFEPLRAIVFEKSEKITFAPAEEYTALLIGPSKEFVPPWASVYTGKDHTLFQESTLQVRRKYSMNHLRTVNYPHEADDHIAVELDFMTILSRLTLDSFTQRKKQQYAELIDRQIDFLTQEMLTWVPVFAEKLQSTGQYVLYPPVAALTCRILQADLAFLREIFDTEKASAQQQCG